MIAFGVGFMIGRVSRRAKTTGDLGVPALSPVRYAQALGIDLEAHGLPGYGVDDVKLRTCRKCGCSDLDCTGCIERTGRACHWIEIDLCSACLPRSR